MKILFIVFAGLMTLMAPVTWAEQQDAVKMSDPNKAIVVDKADATLTIRLASNPTTGFSWFLRNYDANLLVPLGQRYYPPEKMMPGAGGYEEWTFRIKSQGFLVSHTTKMTFVYMRPWEVKAGKAVTFKVVTHVK